MFDEFEDNGSGKKSLHEKLINLLFGRDFSSARIQIDPSKTIKKEKQFTPFVRSTLCSTDVDGSQHGTTTR